MSIFKVLFPAKFDELSRLRNEKSDWAFNIDGSKREIKRLISVKDEILMQKEEMKQKFQSVFRIQEEQSNALKQQLSEIKAQLQERQSELNSTSKLLKEADRKLVEKSIMYDSLHVEHEQLQADVRVFKEKFIEVQKERDELKSLREKQLIAKRNWALKNKKKNGSKKSN